jgi:hypothetical protein
LALDCRCITTLIRQYVYCEVPRANSSLFFPSDLNSVHCMNFLGDPTLMFLPDIQMTRLLDVPTVLYSCLMLFCLSLRCLWEASQSLGANRNMIAPENIFH